MQNTTERSSRSAEGLYKFFIYFVLVLLAVIIAVLYLFLQTRLGFVFRATGDNEDMVKACGAYCFVIAYVIH